MPSGAPSGGERCVQLAVWCLGAVVCTTPFAARSTAVTAIGVTSDGTAGQQGTTPDSASVAAVRRDLQAALATARKNSTADTDSAFRVVVEAPAFDALTASEQHVALASAAASAYHLKQYKRSQQLAIRASALPEQSIDDWHVRMWASMSLGDAPDEATCVITIGHRWGHTLANEPAGLIERIVIDVDAAKLGDERREMLQVLYDIRWQRPDGGQPTRWWRNLSLLLMENNKSEEAIGVATHVTDPYDVIAMLADKRYKPILKSRDVPQNARKAAADEVDRLKSETQNTPRSLSRVAKFAEAMTRAGMDRKALEVTDEVVRRVESAPQGISPYDDLESQYGWVLVRRSRALRHLGRFDEAVATLQHAVQWASDKTSGAGPSHAIVLANLLCELDRPREALDALPSPENLSPNGLAQMELVRLTAATERGDSGEAQRALAWLREHQAQNPSTVQLAQLIAGRTDEAASLLLARLNDPVLRTDALLELQDFADLPAPHRKNQWRAQLKALRERPDIRSAIAQVGKIERYSSIPEVL